MARKVIAVTLLGLLACAALASAQEAAELMKNDKGREQEKENYKQDLDGYRSREQLRDRKERDYKEDKDKKEPKLKPDNRDKPELVRAPKMLYNTEITLEVADEPKFANEGINIGNSAVLKMTLKSQDKIVGYAVLSGIATEVNPNTGSFTLNSIMSIGAVGDKLEGATLTAQGLISWDGVKKKIVKGQDTLIVTGGSGVAAGADGTVTLAGGASAAVPRTLTLKISVPKAHNHKDESEEN